LSAHTQALCFHATHAMFSILKAAKHDRHRRSPER
jgi:hypothetical protein